VRRTLAQRVPRARRHPRRLLVRFGTEGPDQKGAIENLSDSGLFLATNHVFPPRTRIRIQFSFDRSPGLLEGVVQWARQMPASVARVIPSGMGIRLVSAPASYQQLLHRMDEKFSR
jgi:hypothetical protein